MNYKPIILILMLAIGAGIITLLQLRDSSFDPLGKTSPENAVTAPDFTFPDLSGKMVSLKDYRGKIVFLNIWATWCPPCVEEMPSMEKLYQKLKGEGLEILAVSLDETGGEAVGPFIDKHKLTFPVLLDPKGDIKALYRVTGIPESYIIDKNGKLLEKIVGPRDWAATGAIRYFRKLLQ